MPLRLLGSRQMICAYVHTGQRSSPAACVLFSDWVHLRELSVQGRKYKENPE